MEEIDNQTLKNLLMASQLDISNLSLIIKNRVDLPEAEKNILIDISERNIQVANILGLDEEKILEDMQNSN